MLLQERANGFQEINGIFGFLMPEILKNMKYDDFENIVTILIKKYADFFTTDLKVELSGFVDMYFKQDCVSSIDSPLSYLEFIAKNNLIDSFPECCILFRLYLTIPVSSASAERGMSALKVIKEYRRSTLVEDTLNDFGILFIERSVANKINLDSTIDVFYLVSRRRDVDLLKHNIIEFIMF